MSSDLAELTGAGRRCWGALETLHVTAYFAPEPRHAYRELGLRSTAGYFTSRSAAMGPVSAELTVATFYGFAPSLVGSVLPASWEIASPEQVLEARHRGVAATLRRVLGEPDADQAAVLEEAVALAKEACAGLTAPGRALYAAHSSLPWPTDPWLALWHAATLIREHRGDGHIAALVVAGLDPVEAIITSGVASNTIGFMKTTRGWTETQWAAGEQRLRERGLLADDGALTPSGTALRATLEAQTDTAAMTGWQRLGAAGTARLFELVRPWRRAVLASDAIPAGIMARRDGERPASR